MTRAAFAALALAAAPLPAFAQAQDQNLARNLAATCAICHGTEGRTVGNDYAALAGMPRDFIAGQMRAFRDGRRPATVMHQLAKGFTDQQIDLLAAYFAAQKPGPSTPAPMRAY